MTEHDEDIIRNELACCHLWSNEARLAAYEEYRLLLRLDISAGLRAVIEGLRYDTAHAPEVLPLHPLHAERVETLRGQAAPKGEEPAVTVAELEAALARFPADKALGMFEQMNSLLLGNAAWGSRAAAIQQQILERAQQERQPSMHNCQVYQPGSTHEDHSRHLQLDGPHDNNKLIQ